MKGRTGRSSSSCPAVVELGRAGTGQGGEACASPELLLCPQQKDSGFTETKINNNKKIIAFRISSAKSYLKRGSFLEKQASTVCRCILRHGKSGCAGRAGCCGCCTELSGGCAGCHGELPCCQTQNCFDIMRIWQLKCSLLLSLEGKY